MTTFSRSEINTGKLIFTSGSMPQTSFPVTFQKKMATPPNITLRVVKSNKTALAENITPTGFTLIISDDGLDNEETSFEVHYHAIRVY